MNKYVLAFMFFLTHFFVFADQSVHCLDKDYMQQASDFRKRGELDRAILCYKKAKKLRPHDIGIDADLAMCLFKNKQYEESLHFFKKLDFVYPNQQNILSYIGDIQYRLFHVCESIDALEKVLALDKESMHAKHLLASAYLHVGAFEKAFEARKCIDKHAIKVGRQQKEEKIWDGSSLQGKTIVIKDNIGIGDLFCWVRYAKMFKEQGATVIVKARHFLVPILSLCPYLDRVVSPEVDVAFDFQAGVGQLHHRINKTIDDITRYGFYSPYMYADEGLARKWARVLKKDRNFKVGICWQPSLQVDTRTGKDGMNPRAIPLVSLYPLSKVGGVSLYSLQQRAGLEPLGSIPKDFNLHVFKGDFDKKNGSFMDTAAVMKSLDLVITVDTSVAHLAGALGVPVWVMLPYRSDWRWFLERLDSPWYPTMHLFRQPSRGGWDAVVAMIEKELRMLEGKCKKDTAVFSEQVYMDLAYQEKKSGKKVKAIIWYKKAIELNPNNYDAYFQIGSLYCNLQDYEKAFIYFKKSTILPKNYIGFFNMGYCLEMQCKVVEAIQAYEKAISIKPDYTVAINRVKNCYWMLGNLEKARQYWRPEGVIPKISELRGKRILIRDDGGIGDMFFWVRYAQLFKQAGAHVIVEVKKAVYNIISSCPYVDTLVIKGESLPAYDYRVKMVDLPYVFQNTLDTIPVPISYIYSDTALVKKWGKALSGDKNFKIGICWDPQVYRNRAGKVMQNIRAIPLHYFYPLCQMEGVSLYSLQQCNGLEQLQAMPDDFAIHTFDADFDRLAGGFMDTAAVMKQLDLVITADTSIAHLAGALGIPVWVLLPRRADGRWFLERLDSPWYPTMRLFRQINEGDWGAVMKNVQDDLQFLLTVIR